MKILKNNPHKRSIKLFRIELGIGTVIKLLDQQVDGLAGKVAFRHERVVAIGICELLPGDIAFLFEKTQLRGQGIVVRFGIWIVFREVLDEQVAMRP